MAKKRYRPEEIIAKLREAEVLLAQGMKVPEVSKAIGIHEITYYRWRKELGGMKVSQARRLKELEKENSRLRKAVSDLVSRQGSPSIVSRPRLSLPARRPVSPTSVSTTSATLSPAIW
jgi:hypothetical protein